MEKNKYTNGFKIPENYFEEFETHMFDKLKEEQLPKATGFVIPDGYFDAVEEKIIENTKTSPLKVIHKSKTQKLRPTLYRIAGIAAVLAVLILLYPFENGNAISFEKISEAAVSEYIQDGALDLTADDFAMYLQDEDFDALMQSSEEISVENMSDYLLNNLDDSTLLLE